MTLLKRPEPPLELLAPSILVPAQLPRPQAIPPGVKRLYVAVLLSAVEDYRRVQRQREQMPARLLAWFLDYPAAITFAQACDVIGLAPDAVREALGIARRFTTVRLAAGLAVGRRSDGTTYPRRGAGDSGRAVA